MDNDIDAFFIRGNGNRRCVHESVCLLLSSFIKMIKLSENIGFSGNFTVVRYEMDDG